MSRIFSYRGINLLLVIFAIAAMAFALLFLQNYKGLVACPLCIFQRLGLIVMGCFALLAVIVNPKARWARFLLWIGSLAGILWSFIVAARHVWIQHLPADQVPACGPGLQYWLEAFPLQQVVAQVFTGSGECAEIAWRFMGLSIPEQSLILFSFLLILHFILLKYVFRKSYWY